MPNWLRRRLSVLPLLWCAMMLMLFALSMAQANCIDYGDYVHWVGRVDTPGSAYGVAVSGTVAYVADSGSGLQVIDVSNPMSPAILGSVNTPGLAYGVAVSGWAGRAGRYHACGSLSLPACDTRSRDHAQTGPTSAMRPVWEE